MKTVCCITYWFTKFNVTFQMIFYHDRKGFFANNPKFNVFVYNVQDGIEINYATGESKLVKQTESQTPPQTSEPDEAESSSDQDAGSGEMVWIPKSGKKYHSDKTCSNMKNPTQVTKEEAENRGFEPCKRCW